MNTRETAKLFLKSCHAREMSRTESDTWINVHYEIDVVDNGQVVTEIWIENESKLEEPEYRYSLRRFDGDPK